MKHTIFLDAGHGGTDPGAISAYGEEADFNWSIKEALIPELKRNGFYIQETQNGTALINRITWINQRAKNIEDGLAFSVHCNSNGGEGAETVYYDGELNSSGKIAKLLLDAFCQETGLKNRGIKSDKDTPHGRLGWIRDTNCWAVLIECGFVDNQKDVEKLKDSKLMAKGICKGICAIYGIPYIAETPLVNQPTSREKIKADIKKLVDLL